MAPRHDDKLWRWRRFGWWWLDERASNGAVRVLIALQTPETSSGDQEGQEEVDSGRNGPEDLSTGANLLLLWLELIGIGGAAFLLLQLSFVAGLVASRALSTFTSSNLTDAIGAKIVETIATVVGLLSIFGWMFHRPRTLVLCELLGLNRVDAKLLMLFFAANAAALALVSRESNYGSTSEDSKRFNTARALTTLVATPLTEELLFRGLLLHVVLNRTRSAKAAVILSSVLFALLHLANVRKIGLEHFSPRYVALQTLWALVVGGFLSTRVLVSGSLAECLLIHSANNFFAMQAARSVDKDSSTHSTLGELLDCLFGMLSGSE